MERDVVAGRDGQMDPEKEPKTRFLEKHDPAQTLLRWRRSEMIGAGNVELKVAWEPAANFGGKHTG
jgi:hypothetical protein